ncbi:MAG: N-carbamoylputrescine amidase [Gemmatimonadetes bacterium]|nr:N-carbamoylputrescine amidase [Gemmatimonadota bacterium]
MSKVTVAAIQSSFTDDMAKDIARVSALVDEAAKRGARVILPPELFQGHYFCRTEDETYFRRAYPTAEHPAVRAMQEAAKRHGVVIPASYFEKDGPHYYNSVAMVDADGSILGTYRKSHIPDGPGYEEKYYFRPGNSGFRVWPTRYGTVGVGICWDQWFPEAARAMVLMGAELLMYPTAIGSEPAEPTLDTHELWQRAMVGHSVANLVPVVAANRIGNEHGQTFYGHSFVCNHFGEILDQLPAGQEGVIVREVDLAEAAKRRAAFGFFRDRRPDLYGRLVRDE